MKKQVKKHTFKESVLKLYNLANSQLELLKEYYELSVEKIKEQQSLIEKEYRVGQKIGRLIDKIVDKRTFKINNKNLTECNKMILFEDVKFCDIVTNITSDKENKKIYFSINEKYKNNDKINPNIASKKIFDISQYEQILSRSILSDLIATFESILSKLFEILIYENPSKYLENETIPLTNLLVEGLAKEIGNRIDALVEKKTFDSLKLLKNIKTNEEFEIDSAILFVFEEVYYRRNIAIHNDFIVNKKYLNNVDAKLKKGIKDGDKLVCDRNYFEKAFNVVIKLFFYIFYGILQKYSDNINYVHEIGSFAFKKLQEKNYEVAETIYKTISTNKKLEFIDKMMYKINYLNAIKQLGEITKLNKELATLDVSIATDNFKIAKLCLENNHSETYKQLTKTYPKSFSAIAIKEWPLFINFRESDEYRLFCKEHANDFLNEEFIDDSQKNK